MAGAGNIDARNSSIFLSPIKGRLMEVCNTILYSKNLAEVSKAYDMFFTQYRRMLVTGADQIHLSCVEDVIYKILYDETFNQVEQYGLKFSPFAKFISIVKEQNININKLPHLYLRAKNYKYPLMNLKNYILIVVQSEEEYEKRNGYLKNILHQCYVKEI